jgi:superfamily I DNA/RNA helicase
MAEESWAGISYADLAEAQKDFLTSVMQDSDRNFFLKGCAGSGKTVVAAHAIRILRKEQNKSVKLLVYTKLLSKFISDGFRDIGSEVENVEHFHSWRPNFEDKVDMIIVDESQDFQMDWITKVKSFSNNQIWLGDASQQLYADSKNDDGYKSINNEFANSNETSFTTNYRNSISIAQLAKCFINVNEFDHRAGVSLKKKVDDFIIPIANNERQTSGARNQPNIFIEAKNDSDEFDAIAKIIKDIQNGNEPSKQIAIAQLKHDHLDWIDSELRNRGIDFLRISKGKDITELPNFDHRNLTILSPIHSLKGLEFDYIFFPRSEEQKIGFWEEKEINDNLLFVLFSRAKTRIYCSYINKNQSYVYNAIKSDINNDFFQFVSSSEILGDSVPKQSNEEAEKKVEEYFDGLDL